MFEDDEAYSDLDVSNWIFRNDTKVADITDVKFVSTTPGNYQNKYFIIQVLDDNKDDQRYNFWFDSNGTDTYNSYYFIRFSICFKENLGLGLNMFAEKWTDKLAKIIVEKTFDDKNKDLFISIF